MKDPAIWHAFVDREATPEEKQACEAMLKDHCECQQQVISIEALKNFTKIHAEEIFCPVTWNSCCGRLREIDRTTKADRFVARYAWGICGVLFVSILGGGAMNRMKGGSRMDSAAFMQNVASLGPDVPTGASGKREAQWVSELLKEAGSIVTADNLRINNVDNGEIAGHTAKRFCLSDSVGKLSLLVTNADLVVEGMEPVPGAENYMHTMLGDKCCVRWIANGKTLFLISERSVPELLIASKKLSGER